MQGVPHPVSIQVPGSSEYALDRRGRQDNTSHDTQAKVDRKGAIFWRPKKREMTRLMKSIAQQTLKRVFSNDYRCIMIVVVFLSYT